jgi:hypothetical protein
MFDYIQTDDPGAVGAGKSWLNPSSGIAQIRNSSDSGWTLLGSIDVPYLGLAPTSGYTATGAITGISGWAPDVDPDFDNSARLDGINLATVNDLSALRTEMNTSIDARISRAIADYTSKVSVSDRIKVRSGALVFDTSNPTVIPAAQTIPLPIFDSDGVVATEAQCKWLVSTVGFTLDDYTDGGHHFQSLLFTADPSTSRTFAAYINMPFIHIVPGGLTVNYIIIAVR